MEPIMFFVSLIEIGDFLGNPQGCGNSMELQWSEIIIKLGSQLNALYCHRSGSLLNFHFCFPVNARPHASGRIVICIEALAMFASMLSCSSATFFPAPRPRNPYQRNDQTPKSNSQLFGCWIFFVLGFWSLD